MAELLAARLDPPLDRLHGALRLTDAGGDVEQVFARGVDLEHVAAILGLGRILEQLVLGAAGRLLVVLNDLMGLAELIELMAHLGDDGLAHVPRQPHCSEGGLHPRA